MLGHVGGIGGLRAVASLSQACLTATKAFRDRLDIARSTKQGLFEVHVSFTTTSVEPPLPPARGLAQPTLFPSLELLAPVDEEKKRKAKEEPLRTELEWRSKANNVTDSQISEANDGADILKGVSDVQSDLEDDQKAAILCRGVGGTKYTPEPADVQHAAEHVLHQAIDDVDALLRITAMWPFCDDEEASKAGDEEWRRSLKQNHTADQCRNRRLRAAEDIQEVKSQKRVRSQMSGLADSSFDDDDRRHAAAPRQ